MLHRQYAVFCFLLQVLFHLTVICEPLQYIEQQVLNMKLTTTAITAVTNASVAFAAADTTVSTKSARTEPFLLSQ